MFQAPLDTHRWVPNALVRADTHTDTHTQTHTHRQTHVEKQIKQHFGLVETNPVRHRDNELLTPTGSRL